MTVNPQIFALCFLAGAVAVGIWIDARFPRLAPGSLRVAVLHIGATIFAAQLLVPVATHFLTGSQILTLISAFAVGFPALVYSILAGLWIAKLAHAGLRGRLR
jgi:hypothetical protein